MMHIKICEAWISSVILSVLNTVKTFNVILLNKSKNCNAFMHIRIFVRELNCTFTNNYYVRNTKRL